MARLKGLGSEIFSFLWRLLHGLLATQDRVHRILRDRSPSPLCKLCEESVVEDLQHAFFWCNFNNAAGVHLHNFVSSSIPDMPQISTNQILHLNLDLEPSEEFSFIWFISHFLLNIWNARLEKKQVQLFRIRADLEARASILSETRYCNEAVLVKEMIEECFQFM